MPKDNEIPPNKICSEIVQLCVDQNGDAYVLKIQGISTDKPNVYRGKVCIFTLEDYGLNNKIPPYHPTAQAHDQLLQLIPMIGDKKNKFV